MWYIYTIAFVSCSFIIFILRNRPADKFSYTKDVNELVRRQKEFATL